MSTMKKLREEKGLSQVDIVIRTGLNPATVSRLERGYRKPNRSTVNLIAQALGVKPEEIEWPVVTKKG